MHATDIRWSRSFAYRDARVQVTRLADGWRVNMGRNQATQAATLIEALETMRGHAVGDVELRLVLDALACDAPPAKEIDYLALLGSGRSVR